MVVHVKAAVKYARQSAHYLDLLECTLFTVPSATEQLTGTHTESGLCFMAASQILHSDCTQAQHELNVVAHAGCRGLCCASVGSSSASGSAGGCEPADLALSADESVSHSPFAGGQTFLMLVQLLYDVLKPLAGLL